MKWFYLVVGGSLGTVARFALGSLVYRSAGSGFPYGTLVVNVLGCFLVGLLAVLSDEKLLLSPSLKLFLMVGFCGAFTTFSTFILETANLLRVGENVRAMGNIGLSVIVGFLALRVGIWVGRFV